MKKKLKVMSNGWHDLLKNPDDLPTDHTKEYLYVELWDDMDTSYGVGTREYIWYHSQSNDLPFTVIAWCEINPYEIEVDND